MRTLKNQGKKNNKIKRKLTKFCQDLLLFISAGEKDLGIKSFCGKVFPGRSLVARAILRLHLHIYLYLEEVRVFLLDVTRIEIISANTYSIII